MIQQLAQPPATVRMGDGTLARAQTSFHTKPNRPKKLLLVLQYYAEDREAMEDVANLVADLERIRNRNTDILIFGRDDAPEFDRSVKLKLESKFDKVHVLKCRRKGVRGYPYASNEMFYDLVTMVSQFSPWKDDYFAFLNMEADCVPVHPGWLGELIEEFQVAKAHGYSIIGHVHEDPMPHVNGVAVYDIDIWRIVGAGKLNGGNPRIAYDIHHAPSTLPLAQDTPYIRLDFQRPTIKPADLFQNHKGNVEPALFHGVKDSSARDAVRAKHITFSEVNLTSRKTVFTYFSPANAIGVSDSNAVLALWREGWISRGWNPVVLSLREASQNPQYAAAHAAIKKLPNFGSANRLNRWLALETIGGGFLTDYDVLPAQFTPAQLEGIDGIASFSAERESSLSAVQFPADKIGQWVNDLIGYDVKEGEEKVTDRFVFDAVVADPVNEDRFPTVKLFGEPNWKKASLVHFSNAAVLQFATRGQTKSRVMESYLRGE